MTVLLQCVDDAVNTCPQSQLLVLSEKTTLSFIMDMRNGKVTINTFDASDVKLIYR